MAHSPPIRDIDEEIRLPGNTVEYCINCPALEDQAVITLPEDLASIRHRIEQCRKSGRFQGDLCARHFIFDPGYDTIGETEDVPSE